MVSVVSNIALDQLPSKHISSTCTALVLPAVIVLSALAHLL